MQNSLPHDGQMITTANHTGLYDASTHALITEDGRQSLPTDFTWTPHTSRPTSTRAYNHTTLIDVYRFGQAYAATVFKLDTDGQWTAQREIFTRHHNARALLPNF